MKILVRVDASTNIGMGHLMRTLTLAAEAAQRQWSVCFVMRDPDRILVQTIQKAGHQVRSLHSPPRLENKRLESELAHSSWLSVSQRLDAHQTLLVARDFYPDWLIVDHYSLDHCWHNIVREHYKNLMVIDDLADRNLNCKILLDQNFNADAMDYREKIQTECCYLIGPKYALLRKEFSDWRNFSISRRKKNKIENVLITMGGVDKANYTLRIMKELEKSIISNSVNFILIIGKLYPYKKEIRSFCENTNLRTKIILDIKNMAEIMARSDLCIGAAGSTALERCCMALPSLTLSVAENQNKIADALADQGISISTDISTLMANFERCFGQSGKKLIEDLVFFSKDVCDGAGASRVINRMEQLYEN